MTMESLSIISAPSVLSEEWQSFVQAAFIADTSCYQQESAMVELGRLTRMMTAFPQGFRVYAARQPDGSTAPVGYTGWYPVTESVFSQLHDTPEKITHRGFMRPMPEISMSGNWIYLFNYSIIPSMRGTGQSRFLVKNYAAELKDIPVKGIAAVTVSADGARVAEKFGLSYRGDITHNGAAEKVYAARL